MPMDLIDMTKIFSLNLLFIHLSILKVNTKWIFLNNVYRIHSTLTFHFFKSILFFLYLLGLFWYVSSTLIHNNFQNIFFLKFCSSHKANTFKQASLMDIISIL